MKKRLGALAVALGVGLATVALVPPASATERAADGRDTIYTTNYSAGTLVRVGIAPEAPRVQRRRWRLRAPCRTPTASGCSTPTACW